jgi:hypothetical protein
MNVSSALYWIAGNAVCIQLSLGLMRVSLFGPKWASLWSVFSPMNSATSFTSIFSMGLFFLVPAVPLLVLFNGLFIIINRRVVHTGPSKK